MHGQTNLNIFISSGECFYVRQLLETDR